MESFDRNKIYEQLEQAALRYNDLANIPVIASPEPMVALEDQPNLRCNQIGEDMRRITGDAIFVRTQVADMLGIAVEYLNDIDENLSLEVVYGYRSLSIQQQLFNQFEDQLRNQFAGEALLEAVHRLIAVPSVAGHPTGGAVDIQIIENDQPLGFGTRIWEFAPDSYTYSPFISSEAQFNRQLLRTVMLYSGFAPFDGEWWHYSFGDKEWAAYYNRPFAIYDQLEFQLPI